MYSAEKWQLWLMNIVKQEDMKLNFPQDPSELQRICQAEYISTDYKQVLC